MHKYLTLYHRVRARLFMHAYRPAGTHQRVTDMHTCMRHASQQPASNSFLTCSFMHPSSIHHLLFLQGNVHRLASQGISRVYMPFFLLPISGVVSYVNVMVTLVSRGSIHHIAFLFNYLPAPFAHASVLKRLDGHQISDELQVAGRQ